MKIAVIGAGALGGTFATLLARAGHDVTVSVRGAARAVIASDGIHLTGGFGDARAQPSVVGLLTEPPELTLICTKAQDAAAAISDNAAVLDSSPLIVVQNGLDGVSLAQKLLPNSDCFGLLTIIAAHFIGPGRVRVTTSAASYLGRGRGAADDETKRWQAVLDAAFPTVAVDNFVGAQWTKLIVNMLNAVPAITGQSVQYALGHTGMRRVITASMQEAVQIGLASGVQFGALQGLNHRRLHLFATLPPSLAEALPRLMRLRMGSVPNLGSTQQSLKRGIRTEIDFLNGAVVRAADAIGLTAPVNRLLTKLVHDVENSAGTMSPSQVIAAFEALSKL